MPLTHLSVAYLDAVVVLVSVAEQKLEGTKLRCSLLCLSSCLYAACGQIPGFLVVKQIHALKTRRKQMV